MPMDEPAYDLDATRSPQDLFDAANRRHSFVIDLFAEEANTKVGVYFNKRSDAFAIEWPRLTNEAAFPPGVPGCYGWCWANPPYGRGMLPRFVKKALEQVKKGSAIVALIPATPGAGWFNDGILRRCDTLESYTVDDGPITGCCFSMQGIGYRQTVTFLRGRVPFDFPIGWPADKPWNPPATDSILWTLRPPLR